MFTLYKYFVHNLLVFCSYCQLTSPNKCSII
nr:MAG TPA: hypothetical protein [Caudoviricetes sp.]